MSTEQGVYIAETVASKNSKLAKGRFRAYDDQDAVIFCSCKLFFLNILIVVCDELVASKSLPERKSTKCAI